MNQGAEQASQRQILKSTSIIGGSSVISILLGIVRTKVLALLLGPSGIGLVGIYGSIMETIVAAASMGISMSGPRQIAEARGANDSKTIAATHVALTCTVFVFGFIGVALLYVFRGRVSLMSFGNTSHDWAIGILAIGVLFGTLVISCRAQLQGYRLIGNIARAEIIGGFFVTIVALFIICFWREKAIPFFIITTPVFTLFAFSFYARKIPKPVSAPALLDVLMQARTLLALGLAVMLAGIMKTGSGYLVRSMINHAYGLEAAGYFQASWRISTLYIGIVLGAMGSDFYPRLSSIHKDCNASNTLVNQQGEVAYLLAGPAILGMMTLTPVITWLLYSSAFAETNIILRWLILSTILKVALFPLGHVLLAKGMGKTFFCTELAYNASFLLIIRSGLGRFGLPITGFAFFVASLLQFIVVFAIVSRVNGFVWSRLNMTLATVICSSTVLVFAAACYADWLGYMIGSMATLAFSIYSICSLQTIVGAERLQRLVVSIKRFIPFWE